MDPGIQPGGQSGPPADAERIDFASFANPVLINMINRPGRLRDSLRDLTMAAGRPLSSGDGDEASDVHLIRPRIFDRAGGFANPGFRSNLDAHLRAARWAREQGLDRVLVLEDDLSFCDRWTGLGPRLLAELADREWDLAGLGYLDVWDEAPRQADGEPRWERFSGRVNGAHAYLVNARAYDRWIEHLEVVAEGVPGDDLQGPMPSDGALNTFAWIDPEVVRLLAVPNMVGTRPTRSDITPSVVDRLPLIGEVVEYIRSVRRRRFGSKVSNFK